MAITDANQKTIDDAIARDAAADGGSAELSPADRALIEGLGESSPDQQPDVFGSFFKNLEFNSADRAMINTASGGDSPLLFEPYRSGADVDILTSLSLEERVGLQELMWRLDYISDDVQWGFLDAKTVRGFRAVLGSANQNGTRWDVLLEQQKEAVKSGLFTPGELQAGVPQEPLVLPDYDSLKGIVRSKFRDELGRAPTQAEMQQFSNKMMDDYRAEAQRNAPDPQSTNPFADTGAGRGELSEVEPEFTNQISPGANFAENFERLYAGQRASLQDQDEAARTSQQTSNNAGVRPQNTSL